MQRRQVGALIVLLASGAMAAQACSSSSASSGSETRSTTAAVPLDETGPPLSFTLPPSAIPSTGLCRIWVPDSDVSAQLQATGCSGIEYSAPLGSVVLFRPRDGSRNVHVCWMSTSETAVVDGIDAFSVDKLRLVREILPKIRRSDESIKCTYNP